jgi:hypothetical protein
MEVITGVGCKSLIADGTQRTPENLLGRIQDFFDRLGMLSRPISLEYQGNSYRVSCDEQTFMVYRVNRTGGLRHHVPGWPVCLVNRLTIFEEHSFPGLGEDHCASGADIEKWLQIIEHHSQNSPPDIRAR